MTTMKKTGAGVCLVGVGAGGRVELTLLFAADVEDGEIIDPAKAALLLQDPLVSLATISLDPASARDVAARIERAAAMAAGQVS